MFDQEEKPEDGTALDFVRKSLSLPESEAAIAENAELRRVNRELVERAKKIEDEIFALKKASNQTDGDNNEINSDAKSGNESAEVLAEDPIEVEESSDDLQEWNTELEKFRI